MTTKNKALTAGINKSTQEAYTAPLTPEEEAEFAQVHAEEAARVAKKKTKKPASKKATTKKPVAKATKSVKKASPAKKKVVAPIVKAAPVKPAKKAVVASPSPINKKAGGKLIVNSHNILAIHSTMKAPRSFVYKHEEATKQIQLARKCDTLEADVKLLRDTDGKPYPEIKAFVTIANKWKSFLDKIALDIKLRGMNIISIHKLDDVRNAVTEFRSEIKTAAKACITQLPQWKKNAIADNSYLEEKFPTAEYFEAYDLIVRHFPFASDKVTLPENGEMEMEIAREAIGKLAESVSDTFTALTNYLDGKAKKFTENSLTSMFENASNLKESGFISNDQYDTLLETVSKLSTSTNAPAIREAKERIEKGVTVVNENVIKRGRKATPVSQEDIDECKQYIKETLQPFETVMAEIEELAKGLV